MPAQLVGRYESIERGEQVNHVSTIKLEAQSWPRAAAVRANSLGVAVLKLWRGKAWCRHEEVTPKAGSTGKVIEGELI